MKPTLGRIVLYRLTGDDAEAINRRRADAEGRMTAIREERTGYQVHVGNLAHGGQVYPAVVVRMVDGAPAVNLRVLLDGSDTYWATSRAEGDERGQWSWPPRVS